MPALQGASMDWRQLWEIISAPDNVPIVGLIPLLAFYIYLAWKQAHANDQLVAQLETDPAMAKTHHRKTWPFKPGWQKEVHVWPFLLRIEFLAAIIVTIILMVWSITLNAPLEEPANPNLSKAIFGLVIVGGYFALGGFLVYSLFRRYMAKDFSRMSLLQFSITQAFLLIMVALPLKMLLRLLWHIKYVWITPWFNI